MTVQNLIDALLKLDPSLPVFTNWGDGFITDFDSDSISINTVVKVNNQGEFTGPFETTHAENPKGFKAVVIA